MSEELPKEKIREIEREIISIIGDDSYNFDRIKVDSIREEECHNTYFSS